MAVVGQDGGRLVAARSGVGRGGGQVRGRLAAAPSVQVLLVVLMMMMMMQRVSAVAVHRETRGHAAAALDSVVFGSRHSLKLGCSKYDLPLTYLSGCARVESKGTVVAIAPHDRLKG